MDTQTLVAAILDSVPAHEGALGPVLGELRTLPYKELRAVNLDVPSTISRVLGAVPGILKLREELAVHTPTAALAEIDKLEEYAFALYEAHFARGYKNRAPEELRILGEEGSRLRTLLRGDAITLERRELLVGHTVRACRGLAGYRNIATDLHLLVRVLRDCWPAIQSKCAVTEEELTLAERIGHALMVRVGAWQQSKNDAPAGAELRVRAFTMLVNTYEEARAAIVYLRRRQNDADKIAPSLYAGRKRISKVVEEKPPAEAVPAPQAANQVEAVPSPVVPSVQTTSVPVTRLLAPGLVGLPGGRPFLENDRPFAPNLRPGWPLAGGP